MRPDIYSILLVSSRTGFRDVEHEQRIPFLRLLRTDHHQEWLMLAGWSLLRRQRSDGSTDPDSGSSVGLLWSSRLRVLDCSVHDLLRFHVEPFFVPLLEDLEVIAALPRQGGSPVPLHLGSSLHQSRARKRNTVSLDWR
jgi:hypothetical protein